MMPFRYFLPLLLSGFFSLLNPTLGLGHGAEFLLAKLAFDQDARVTLEMTADYGDNPMIGSEDEARTALAGLLQVEVGGAWKPLGELAALRMEQRSQLDLTSPMPYAADENKTPHQLLVATWQWLPTSESLRFQVPKGCKYDVLFWKASEPGKQETQPWKLLIAEDTTPVIEVPQRGSNAVWIAVELSGLLVIVLVVRALRRMDW